MELKKKLLMQGKCDLQINLTNSMWTDIHCCMLFLLIQGVFFK